MKNELQTLMDDIHEWSDATFEGQRNPAIVHHLSKEVKELIDALDKCIALGVDNSTGIGEFNRALTKVYDEYADCFMLLLDSASHFGLTSELLIQVTINKLEVNKKRKWGKPDENGVVEHIKPQQP